MFHNPETPVTEEERERRTGGELVVERKEDTRVRRCVSSPDSWKEKESFLFSA